MATYYLKETMRHYAVACAIDVQKNKVQLSITFRPNGDRIKPLVCSAESNEPGAAWLLLEEALEKFIAKHGELHPSLTRPMIDMPNFPRLKMPLVMVGVYPGDNQFGQGFEAIEPVVEQAANNYIVLQ